MEKIIVYMQNQEAVAELCEFLQNKGYIPFFISGEAELLASISQQDFSKLILKIQNLSDIRLLHTIQSIFPSLETNLIIQPDLQEIIQLLKNKNFNIVNDFMQIN